MSYEEMKHMTFETVCRKNTWSQLYCTRWWQHFAMAMEGDRLRSLDELPF
jgi:hypothetical protein